MMQNTKNQTEGTMKEQTEMTHDLLNHVASFGHLVVCGLYRSVWWLNGSYIVEDYVRHQVIIKGSWANGRMTTPPGMAFFKVPVIL
jgi:hypothetical protein